MNDYLSMKDACKWLGLSESTLYKLTAKRQIPFCKPTKGRLIFIREEIEAWIKDAKVQMAGTEELPIVKLKKRKK